MKPLIIIIIFLFFVDELFAQQIPFSNGIYTNWKKLKARNPLPNVDSCYFKERSIREVRIAGGNDYELISKQMKPFSSRQLKNIFAVVLNGMIFINGKKISLPAHFCKSMLVGKKLIFLGCVPTKQQAHYDELIAIYGATGGFEQRFVADLNEQRHVYYLDMSKRKPKVVRVTKSIIQSLLKNNSDAYKAYIKEPNPENNAVLLKYLKMEKAK